MKIHRRTLIKDPPGQALRRAEARLIRQGYRLTARDEQGADIYERGSMIGSMWSSNPAHIHTCTQIRAWHSDQGTEVLIEQDLHLLGQIITRADMNFWKAELDGLSLELRTGHQQPLDWRWARRASWWGLIGPLLCILWPLIPSVMTASLFQSPLALLMTHMGLMSSSFALMLLLLRHNMLSPEDLAQDPWNHQEVEVDAEQRQEASRRALEDFDKRLGQAQDTHEPVLVSIIPERGDEGLDLGDPSRLAR